MLKRVFPFILLVISAGIFAAKFQPDASYEVCFTPGQNCTSLIVGKIAQAKSQVLVQAYSFTSVPIAKALLQAAKRGVDVKIILDKSQTKNHGFSSAKMFSDYRIPLWIDYVPTIAHNKVMIIDDATVITGSFNFTRAAQERNAENVIVISDKLLAKQYKNNWQNHQQDSSAYRNNESPF